MAALGVVEAGLTILLLIMGGLGAVLYGTSKNLRQARDDANALAETRGERIADLEDERKRDKAVIDKAHTEAEVLREMAQGVPKLEPKLDLIITGLQRMEARLGDRT